MAVLLKNRVFECLQRNDLARRTPSPCDELQLGAMHPGRGLIG